MKADRYLGGAIGFVAFVLYVLWTIFDLVEVIGLVMIFGGIIAAYLQKKEPVDGWRI